MLIIFFKSSCCRLPHSGNEIFFNRLSFSENISFGPATKPKGFRKAEKGDSFLWKYQQLEWYPLGKKYTMRKKKYDRYATELKGMLAYWEVRQGNRGWVKYLFIWHFWKNIFKRENKCRLKIKAFLSKWEKLKLYIFTKPVCWWQESQKGN